VACRKAVSTSSGTVSAGTALAEEADAGADAGADAAVESLGADEAESAGALELAVPEEDEHPATLIESPTTATTAASFTGEVMGTPYAAVR
jgi:hypothetical protein